MNANSTDTTPNEAQQQHGESLDLSAAEACRRSPNMDRLNTSILAAKLHTARSADAFSMPQTIFRTRDTAGWWHTHSYARVLANAEVFATILPARYFQ